MPSKKHRQLLLSLIMMGLGVMVIYNSVEWGLWGAYNLFDLFRAQKVDIQDHTDKFMWLSMVKYQLIGILIFIAGLIILVQPDRSPS